jgi:multimeric flavodoxin WrbA
MPGYVLGIAGSPRRHGNSEQLLDACLDALAGAGVETRKVVAVEMGIEACRGCNACSLTGECVIRDRMREVYPLLEEASAIVVASPVFFATVPAVLKALYDRCQPYWARVHVLKEEPLPSRPGGYLLVRGGGDPYGFDAAAKTTRSVFAVLSVRPVLHFEYEGLDSPSDAARHPEALEGARTLAADLARLLAEGSGAGSP